MEGYIIYNREKRDYEVWDYSGSFCIAVIVPRRLEDGIISFDCECGKSFLEKGGARNHVLMDHKPISAL